MFLSAIKIKKKLEPFSIHSSNYISNNFYLRQIPLNPKFLN